MKRVTDPFDEKARARIVGGETEATTANDVSTGSEHSAVADCGCLSDLFFSVAADDTADEMGEQELDPDPSMYGLTDANFDLIRRNSGDQIQMDSFMKEIESHVGRAVQKFGCVRMEKQILLRSVTAYLRNHGYDAAICKTKWTSCGGLTAGSHEFIDVLRPELDPARRYIIDLDLAAEFEIARPTDAYDHLLQQLPGVFVGTAEELKCILKVMTAAARSSLKYRNLRLPPWRKHRFMVSMWFGPYRRTANVIPTQSYVIKCRAVGFDFDASVDGARVQLPLTAALGDHSGPIFPTPQRSHLSHSFPKMGCVPHV